MSDSVEERWRSLMDRGEAEAREVDAASPLRMLVGVTNAGRPYFVVIVRQKPGFPELTEAIEVTRRQRSTDQQWTLTLELQVPALTDAFISLVSELAGKSAGAATEAEALTMFLETLFEWQELLTARVDRLSEEALRGLISELWFGFKSSEHGHTQADAVHAWGGPLGGAQEFAFLSPGLKYEVKSLRPTRTKVEISSEDQLDGSDVILAVVTLEQVDPNPASLTLPSLVSSIRAELKDGPDRAEFNHRFAMLQVNPDDDWYATQHFSVTRLRTFAVREVFPALRRSRLPAAISQTRYRVDLDEVADFLVTDSIYEDQGDASHG